MTRALVAERREIEAIEQMLARPQHLRRDRDVHLVDEPRFEILPDRRHSAVDLHVLPAGGCHRASIRLANTTRDKVENSPTFHLDRLATVMGQHKHGTVVRRVFAPPPTPRVIGPGTPDWPEHVAPHAPRADALTEAGGDVVVDTCRAAHFAIDALEGARRDEPIMQRFAADSQGTLARLRRAGAVAVERDGEVVYAHTRHRRSGGWWRLSELQFLPVRRATRNEIDNSSRERCNGLPRDRYDQVTQRSFAMP